MKPFLIYPIKDAISIRTFQELETCYEWACTVHSKIALIL